MIKIRILIVPLLLGSWVFAFLTCNEIRTKSSGNWIETSATVIELSTPSSVHSGKSNHRQFGTCIHYSYVVGGILREGKECGIFSSFNTKEEASHALEAYLAEKKGDFMVRYLRDNLDDSYLVVPQKMKRTQYAFIVSLPSAIILSLLALKLYFKKQKHIVSESDQR